MLRKADEAHQPAQAGKFRRYAEMIDRPMGILDATEAAMKDSSALECFAHLLYEGSGRVRERTAWALGYAAAKGGDITGAVEALLRLVDESDPDLVRGSAYALANHYMNNGEPEKMDLLKAHRNLHARIGAQLASLDRP